MTETQTQKPNPTGKARFPEKVNPMWAIYEIANQFFLFQWVDIQAGHFFFRVPACVGPDLDTVRSRVPAGAINTGRTENDPENLVEVWV